MHTLILDIGRTNLKTFIVNNKECFEYYLQPTPINPNEVFEISRKIVDRAIMAYNISTIITTSFGDSVVVEDIKGEWILQYATDPCPKVKNLPHYRDTGYSNAFPGLIRQLITLDQRGVDYRRALPMSAALSVYLTDNTNWKYWDWTHASNSGAFHQKTKRWVSTFSRRTISPKIVSPLEIVGTYKKINVVVGGHDVSFVGIDTQNYVVCGTWIIISERRNPFTPKTDEKGKVRWIRDPCTRLHRQICFKSPGQLSNEIYDKIMDFYKAPTSKIIVVGPYSEELKEGLKKRYEGLKILSVPLKQHLNAGNLVGQGINT